MATSVQLQPHGKFASAMIITGHGRTARSEYLQYSSDLVELLQVAPRNPIDVPEPFHLQGIHRNDAVCTSNSP